MSGLDITVDQAALNRALTLVRQAAVKTHLHATGCVLLDASDPDVLDLYCSDAAHTLRCQIALDAAEGEPRVREPGAVLVDAATLAGWVGLVDGQINLRAAGGAKKLVATAFGAIGTFGLIPTEDLPLLAPAEGSELRVSLDGPAFADGLERVASARATDYSRPILAHVLLSFGSDTLTMAAADGFRLAIATVPGDADPPRKILLPGEAVRALLAILKGRSERLRIALDDDHGLTFSCGTASVTCRAGQGEFPAYERIIPDDSRCVVEVAIAGLERAIKAGRLFGRGGVQLVPLEDSLDCLTEGDAAGASEMHLPADVTGSCAPVHVSAVYLAEALKAIPGDDVAILLTGWDKPVVLQPTGIDPVTRQVIMPLNPKGGTS